MRCCCFTHGKKRLYAAAVFFEDEDEDVGFLSSFEREREREREQQQQHQQQQNHARHHQYHAFVKVTLYARVFTHSCRGLNWNCLGYLPVWYILYLEITSHLRAYIYYPICGHCYSLKANNNVRRGGLHRRFQILRPTHHRPSIRPIFQRHNRFERKREIKHFGFHLLRPRDHEFKSGTYLCIEKEGSFLLRTLCVFFLAFFRVWERYDTSSVSRKRRERFWFWIFVPLLGCSSLEVDFCKRMTHMSLLSLYLDVYDQITH